MAAVKCKALPSYCKGVVQYVVGGVTSCLFTLMQMMEE